MLTRIPTGLAGAIGTGHEGDAMSFEHQQLRRHERFAASDEGSGNRSLGGLWTQLGIGLGMIVAVYATVILAGGGVS